MTRRAATLAPQVPKMRNRGPGRDNTEIDVVLTLPEEIILLMLENESGKFIPVPEHCIHHALAGAVLMELAFQGKIGTDPERLFAVDCDPISDDLLDPTLHHICSSEEQKDLRDWIGFIGREAGNIRKRALARLCEKGVLKSEDDLLLWVFKSRRYPTCDGSTERREVKLRMMSLLFSQDTPEPRDIAIIGLADTCRIFEYLLARPELDRARARIDQIRNLEPIACVLNSVVAEIDMQVARSTAIQPMG